MHVTIRTIGNSKGIVLPKPLLAQAGLEGCKTADITLENGTIVLRKPATTPRSGWAEAAAALGESELLIGEFGNQGDAELVW
ncbi:MAG: AbrB/MazE/SpoVT family DNA-binding domain-containing protein [Acidovorax sp.]|uniref:AbrB/MazE/SpoVT family DNA-binding domain-containing protein n=1 Tax=Acidovorax sp. TaxID=1872122 RepID=UPI0039E333AA